MCGILGGVDALESFAGLLDRSVRDIAALAADARTFDAFRIGPIATIWDNNSYPLVSAACAGWPWRTRRARAGLLWMAALGAARRAVMVDLDPALDRHSCSSAWRTSPSCGSMRPTGSG